MTVKNLAGVIPMTHSVALGISWVLIIAVILAVISGLSWAANKMRGKK